MAYITIPLTGSGDATARVATDKIGDEHYQLMKLVDGAAGSSLAVAALSSAPGSTDAGLVVRNIPSGTQPVSGTVLLDDSTAAIGVVTADLSSVGSTKLVGQVTVANPTTAVTLSSGSVLGGSTAVIGEVTPTSVGSTRLMGQVTVANPTTAVTVSSGVVLGGSTQMTGLISSGTQTIGSVQLTSAGTTGSIGSVALLAGSTANVLGSVIAGTAGSTTNTVGSVALLAGSSANTIGSVGVTTGSIGLSSDGSTKFVGINNYESFTVASRTSVASSVDVALFAAATAVRCRIVQNSATGVELLINLSTVAVSSAAGGDIRVPALGYVVFGGQTGNFPLYVGAMRCHVNSTAINTNTIGIQLTT